MSIKENPAVLFLPFEQYRTPPVPYSYLIIDFEQYKTPDVP